jgi:hypothetical protein
MLMMIRALVPALLGLSLGLPMGAAAQSRLPPCPAEAAYQRKTQRGTGNDRS